MCNFIFDNCQEERWKKYCLFGKTQGIDSVTEDENKASKEINMDGYLSNPKTNNTEEQKKGKNDGCMTGW